VSCGLVAEQDLMYSKQIRNEWLGSTTAGSRRRQQVRGVGVSKIEPDGGQTKEPQQQTKQTNQ